MRFFGIEVVERAFARGAQMILLVIEFLKQNPYPRHVILSGIL